MLLVARIREKPASNRQTISYTQTSRGRSFILLTGIKMQSIQLKTQVNADGFVLVQMPAELKNRQVEVMLVFQPLSSPTTTESLYPDGRFYGACADDSIVIDNESIDPSLDDDGDLISGVA
jgi:hypothetical protein